MNPDEYETVGEHFRWIRATSEIEDLRTGCRRPDSFYPVKVDVYEDRVRFWFLNVARDHVVRGSAPGDYVALSIALAYIEGVEQYRRGRRTPHRESASWFQASARRTFPRADPRALEKLWFEARCGLFHDGFTRGKTVVSHAPAEAISLIDGYLAINPARFIAEVIGDFEAYVRLLRNEVSGAPAARFTDLWDDQWNAT